ncbi:MAG TPA: PRC-barrel domain-containing protein [Solirubrobacteraceae bacterium]|jgi:hypothetical protein|nr:PRC-barrel domain-containing protein [Solirubrobacteraceae bacterium]
MDEGVQYTIGSEVSCSDGPCGKLERVVVDPVARALTHLVVEPPHDPSGARLVPVALVTSATHPITLSVTKAEFDALEAAEKTEFIDPQDAAAYGYGSGQVLSLPYFGLGFGPRMDLGSDIPAAGRFVFRDRVPVGEVSVRRGDEVEATDGGIGRVRGLVIDPADHHVTHFLLEEGHLWGKKVVAIPIGAVSDVAEGVRITLSKEEVGALPAVQLQTD